MKNMSDNLTKSQRTFCMSRIRSKGTKIELRLKSKLKKFVYQPKMFGRPDFADLKNKKVIFIDGCFFHKCPKHFIKPKSNKKYWLPKLERNAVRDKEVYIAYKLAGWKVIRIWEHDI